MEQPNTEIPTPPQPENIQSVLAPPPPQKSNLPMIFIIVLLLVFFTSVGIVLGKYVLNQTTPPAEKLILPTPTSIQAMVTSTTTADPTANWKKYTNTTIGIEFRYPADPKWNIEEKTQGDNSLTIYNYDVKKAPGRSYVPNIDGDIFKIEISKQKNNLTANDWLNQQKSILNPITDKPNEFINTKKITVDAHKGIYYETKDELSGIIMGGAVFEGSDKSLVFSFGGLNFEGNRQVFNQILSTFKFLPSTSSGQAGQTQTDETANWKTYTNGVWNYFLKYPEDKLVACEYGDGNTQGFWSTPFNCPVGHDLMYEIGIIGSKPGEYKPYKTPRSTKEIVINGIKAVQNKYTYGPEDGPLADLKESTEVVFTRNNGTIAIQFIGTDINKLDRFNQILSTFKFLD